MYMVTPCPSTLTLTFTLTLTLTLTPHHVTQTLALHPGTAVIAQGCALYVALPAGNPNHNHNPSLHLNATLQPQPQPQPLPTTPNPTPTSQPTDMTPTAKLYFVAEALSPVRYKTCPVNSPISGKLPLGSATAGKRARVRAAGPAGGAEAAEAGAGNGNGRDAGLGLRNVAKKLQL